MKTINQQIMDAFNFRHACKAFDPKQKISESDFETIIESGRLSPSSFGFEPWKFLVIQDESLRAELTEVSWGGQKQIPTSSHFVVILARKASDVRGATPYIQHVMQDVQKLPEDIQKMKGDFFTNFQQNDFDLTEDRALFDWASKQTYIALGNMMTSAALLGIDSCPMEGFNKVKFEAVLEAKGLLDPEHFGVSVLVAFGYRDPANPMFDKTRGSQSELVAWI